MCNNELLINLIMQVKPIKWWHVDDMDAWKEKKN